MKSSQKNAIIKITRASIIAALYAALTIAAAPISFGQVQFRISEALCVLPVFFPEAAAGLFVGCIVANLVSPNILILDIVFGSLATLASALLTGKIGYKKLLAPLPPVLINAVVISAVVTFSAAGASAGAFSAYIYNMLTIGAGQFVVCYGAGIPLMMLLNKMKSKGIYPFNP
ncbi:MAG: QueT transporter family protein [Firmicutes bacterium]|nr:QueT transporter family protein [Bacillota bacterium]